MTRVITDYATNFRDGTEYECRVVKRRWRFTKVYWYEGPDKGHYEWMHRDHVKEYCLRKPTDRCPVVQ